MAKADVLKKVVEKVALVKSQKEAGVVFDAVLEAIKEAVAEGEDVRTVLGTFKKVEKKGRHIAARTMTHPTTGKPIEIKEQDTPDKTVLTLKSKVEF